MSSKGSLALVYGVVCYALFLGVFLYAIGFVGDFLVPKSIDGPGRFELGALLVDLALLGLFAVQHSTMARPAFKRRWTRIVPAHLERSTFVLVTSLILALLFWQWRPFGAVVWQVDATALRAVIWALFALGWAVVLVSTFVIDHFDLFGLRQTWLYAQGKPYSPPGFKDSVLYRTVRHPLMLGFLIAFWATPRMTLGHLVFAIATTCYVLIAIQIEERDLLAMHDEYEDYRRRVPMLLPLRKRETKRTVRSSG
jgi:protein-S-isoprenylcysteine O-methyltransferase Ste14